MQLKQSETKPKTLRKAAEYRKNNPLQKNFFEEHTLWDQEYLGSSTAEDARENLEKFKKILTA
jgi:hypothetical protein